jgi:N6-L-threonylcarbamoyladenine synthase
MFFLGLDTSNYVSSLALIETGFGHQPRLRFEKRTKLRVDKGEKGLRQAEAVFQHLRNMPELWEEVSSFCPLKELAGVSASTKPRPLQGSYMPVFQVGHSFGLSVASLLQIPFYPFSHQEGHLQAGLWSSGCFAKRFLALHLSGGTTEILHVYNSSPGNLEIEILGGTSDLNAGQFVDRIGVKLGFPFPAGVELEKMAARSKEGGLKVPVSVKDYTLSFSGPATFVERALDDGVLPEEAARGVELCLAKSFLKLISKAVAEQGLSDILIVGGIAANAFIRKSLLEGLPGGNFFFPDAGFAGDNAVGTAILAALQHQNR